MILVLNKDITKDQKSHIRNTLMDKGCFVRETEDAGQNIIGALGKSNLDVAFLKSLPGVETITPITTPFKPWQFEMTRFTCSGRRKSPVAQSRFTWMSRAISMPDTCT